MRRMIVRALAIGALLLTLGGAAALGTVAPAAPALAGAGSGIPQLAPGQCLYYTLEDDEGATVPGYFLVVRGRGPGNTPQLEITTTTPTSCPSGGEVVLDFP